MERGGAVLRERLVKDADFGVDMWDWAWWFAMRVDEYLSRHI